MNIRQSYLIKKIDAYYKFNNKKKKAAKGYCYALSIYWLYKKSNHKENEFFDDLITLSEWEPGKDNKRVSALIEKLEKIQSGEQFIYHQYSQSNELMNIVLQNEDELPVVTDHVFSFNLSPYELEDTLSKILTQDKMFLLQTVEHAVAVYYENGQYYFYDSNDDYDETVLLNKDKKVYSFTNLSELSQAIQSSLKFDHSVDIIPLQIFQMKHIEELTAYLPTIDELQVNYEKNGISLAQRKDWKGNHPLHTAITAGDDEYAIYLLDKLKSENENFFIDSIQNSKGDNPLHYALIYNNHFILNYLLMDDIKTNSFVFNINQCDHNDYTPLQYAILVKEDQFAVELLLKAGADINIPLPMDAPEDYLYDYLFNGDNDEMLEIVFLHNQKNKCLFELMYFCYKNDYLAIEKTISMLKNETSDSKYHEILNLISGAAFTPFSFAINNQEIKLIKLLLQAGIKATIESTYGHPLYQAAVLGNLEIVELLLSDKNTVADIDHSFNGLTALGIAVIKNQIEIIEALCLSGASLNKALISVLNYGASPDAIVLLFKRGAELDYIDSGTGLTPLEMAIFNNDIESMAIILTLNPRLALSKHSSKKMSVLELAQSQENEDILEIIQKFQHIGHSSSFTTQIVDLINDYIKEKGHQASFELAKSFSLTGENNFSLFQSINKDDNKILNNIKNYCNKNINASPDQIENLIKEETKEHNFKDKELDSLFKFINNTLIPAYKHVSLYDIHMNNTFAI